MSLKKQGKGMSKGVSVELHRKTRPAQLVIGKGEQTDAGSPPRPRRSRVARPRVAARDRD